MKNRNTDAFPEHYDLSIVEGIAQEMAEQEFLSQRTAKHIGAAVRKLRTQREKSAK